MAGKAGTLELLAHQLGTALLPLESELAAGNVSQLFADLGLQFPPQLLAQAGFTQALTTASTAAGQLTGLLSQLATDVEADNETAILQDGLQLIGQVGTLVSALETIGTELGNAAGSLPGMNPAEVGTFAQSLASNLLSFMVISYLKELQPSAVGIANIMGLLDYLPQPGIPGDPAHPPFTLRKLQLSKLGDVFTTPLDLLKTLYDWGDDGFDGTKLMPRLNTSLNLLGFRNPVGAPAAVDSLYVSLFSLRVDSSTHPPGLLASLQHPIFSNFDLTIPLSEVWSVEVVAQGSFAAGLQAAISPPANVGITPPTGTLTGQMNMKLQAAGKDDAHPLVLIGQTGGSRLEAKAISLGAGTTLTWDSGTGKAIVDPLIEAGIKGGKVVIDMSNADGFLATVLSGVHVEAGFDLQVTWALETGLHISGGAQLEIDFPLHLDLGPVTLPTLYLVGGVGSSGIPLEISAALDLSLGPIQASVDRVGVKALLAFPAHGGNLGPADLTMAFKPPNGLGLNIDAGAIAGGGYISFDPDKGQYAGVLDVSIAEVIQIKVIGVLDTIMPDGSHGFSFLLIITFDLPPIQLGFGFTLNGVGGLGGVNRTMSIDALHAGFRAHTLDSIMFPPDPVVNAAEIISNIRSFFPPAQDRYLLGPMLEVGWGTPTLITLEIGVIIEVPDPIRLAILGLIHAGLPTEDVPLIELHIDILGTLDFGTKTFELDGSLYDSHVLIFSLAGDLLFRLCWGDNPIFIFSLGGFNPHFNTTGLNIPAMQRLSVSIGDGDNPRISANSYFAITSNSLQFGANVEAYASAAGFAIHGYLGFDVLIIFSPFSFEFDFSAGFDVSFEGVSLLGLNVDGLFSGPRPWHLHGDASIHILFFSVSASVDLTWGDATQVTLPAKPVLPDLLPALASPANWSSELPDGSAQAVTLKPVKPDDKTLLVHPLGVVSVSEKIVPLDLPITRYGNATPSDGTQFSISQVQLNGTAATKQNFQDYFADGQFLTLSDADKLSRPSFERYDAGVKLGTPTILSGSDSPRTVMYEERYIDVPSGFARLTGRYALSAAIHSSLVRQGAGYQSPLKNTGLNAYKAGPAPTPITTGDPSYVVAGVTDLSVRSDIGSASGTTYFQARAALEAHLAAHPEDEPELQIIPTHELAA